MPGSLDDWHWIVSPDAKPLLDAAGRIDQPTPRDVAQLRARWSASQVTVALELSKARRKAASKFPNRSDLVADVEGIEQASSSDVARHKARRFEAMGAKHILDICCGIGGDTMALAGVSSVTAIDLDPIRAWMAGRNAGCGSRCEDAADVTADADAVHIDPARRTGARRIARWEEYQPGPTVIESLLRRYPHASVKLGPGVEVESVPRGAQDEMEFVSEHGVLVQCIWWRGALAHHEGKFTATMLPSGESLVGSFCADVSGEHEIEDVIHIADPAAERAGVVHILARMTGSSTIHPGLHWLTSKAPVSSPWLRSFTICTVMPWREGAVKRWLTNHDGGQVEVKCRGVRVDTDGVQQKLRGAGARAYVVLVFRRGRHVHAAVAERVRTDCAVV